MPSAANDIDDKGAALLEAAASGRLDAVRDLIDLGAPVDRQDVEGNTALLKAALNGWTEIVHALLLSGADIDHVNHKGQTALYMAAWCPMQPDPTSPTPSPRRAARHDETVRELLRWGAETEYYETGGLQPVSAAGVNGNITAMLELLAEGARFLSDEVIGGEPPSVGLIQAIDELLDADDAPPRAPPAVYDGWTPLPPDRGERRAKLLEALLTCASAYSAIAEPIIEARRRVRADGGSV